MNNTSETNWAKLDALSESEIDTSDVPPLTEEFFNKSRWWKPVSSLNALVQIDPQTLAWFQSQSDDYEKKSRQHYEFMQKLIKQLSLLLKIKFIIEEILENFGLAKLMQEVEDGELLSSDEAYSYYQSLKRYD